MSDGGQGNQSVGLRDVFDILVKAPPERLLSLTFQLRESPEDTIIHALCLIVLQRGAQGLDKLHAMQGNYVAKHLAEKWQMSHGKLEEFAAHCDHNQEFTRENFVVLARIFKVLSEQRLCDPLLRNLAYQRALSSDDRRRSGDENVEFDQLREEAKAVCGPRLAEWMCSSVDHKPGPCRELRGSLDKGSTALKVTLSPDPSASAHSRPSSLQSSSPTLSYPSHLEISIPPTALFQDSTRAPEALHKSRPNSSAVGASEAREAPLHSHPSEEFKSNHPLFNEKKHSREDETFAAESAKLDRLISGTQTSKPNTESHFALAAATNASETHESNSADEEEEMFYAFVIMHAPEDADVAETMRERVESVIGSPGATFSNDFAIAGKSTLRCVEDAINNTAFTLLLLTRNFNTRMLDMETDSALTNSLNKKHKYNTVIPLLPRENRMPKTDIPMVLQTIVHLEENRNFERKVQRSLSAARIKSQKKIWAEEQRVKTQIQKQEKLKQRKKQLIKEYEAAELLEKESLRLLRTQKLLLGLSVSTDQDGGGEDRACWQHPNIHIENAKYIMIGNDSQMTVDLGGVEDKDDSIDREEEQ